jgi:PTH1 family peptidyl-tRNA hydrolase
MKYLIVGLGNIGPKYENTRHNAGFKVLDSLIDTKEDVDFETVKLGDVAEYKFKGRKAILLKPSTFMNLSGKAVAYWMQKEKIPVDRVLIITDDIALPFGTIRLRAKGSAGGHNGLKDIQAHLGHDKYARLKFGVGADFGKGRQVEYVLGDWDRDEEDELPELLKKAKSFIHSYMMMGVQRTMNDLNKNKPKKVD